MEEEHHPFQPFLPPQARLLMLGTFPPAEKRWCMPFYYPNFTNDMWRIFGISFFGDKHHFVDEARRSYRLDLIEPFLRERGIAMYDVARRIVRTRNTASDKDLLIVEETNLKAMLQQLPLCRTIVTAGQLATTVACRQLALSEPRLGEYTELEKPGSTSLRLYRMPSSSRAYPMAVERKAEYYSTVLLNREIIRR
jgi:G:T/U-mismatch repair DNA glycosylase